ncbi:MAG: DEAD/DEAH box helicase [Desulfuromonadales bacterium]|nr:MAG: DEAD/DEAH box helicase [Desulfuromonadales bacterium]
MADDARVLNEVTPVYWEAQRFAEALHRDFEDARRREDVVAMRGRFYLLARYYGRTLAILRHALSEGREPLLRATLRNLISLHQPLHHMHDLAPAKVPLALTLDRQLRRRLLEDLIVEVLQEASEAMSLHLVAKRVNELHLLADADDAVVREHLENLVASGHVEKGKGGFSRTTRAYSTINLDRSSLEALLGSRLYRRFEEGGFHVLEAIVDRKEAFHSFFQELTGFAPETADLFVAAARELIGPPSVAPDLIPWHHADLIGSLHPRPYQHDAFAIFRGYGYRGQVIEAPTGSGKTLIGMMCIQDWMRSLSPGESILVLVPTVNYQQQWFAELCYKPVGLRLAPDLIFTGTPALLEEEGKTTSISPVILVMTYSALAQTGSGTGKGGFDQGSIEMFLQQNNVQYVILDEVHKVVENTRSVSADITRLLMEWLRDGSLEGVIGFSGTAAAYRRRFAKLGLELVYTMPAADLIAYGFVAPYTEFGVPFAYSDREHRIRLLLDGYKEALRAFIALVGSGTLRGWLAGVPTEERLVIGRDLLRMYAGRRDRDSLIEERLRGWETGGTITLAELHLLSLVQIARGWSDGELAAQSGDGLPEEEREERRGRFQDILLRLEGLRRRLREDIYLPDMVERLAAPGFGTFLDVAALGELRKGNAAGEGEKELLATTFVGLYDILKTFYLRAGEGKVDAIRAIVRAERSVRPVTGVIVFDGGKRIRWEEGVAIPGYSGVAGVFAQMLGDRHATPIAVLSREIYLPWDERKRLPASIAGFIRDDIMLRELGGELCGLVTQGIELTAGALEELRLSFATTLDRYIRGLLPVHAHRSAEFNREVLKPLRRDMAGMTSLVAGGGEKLLARLSLRHQYLRKWVDALFDYALIATRFLEARVGQLRQVSGEIRKFFVVTMPEGDRKQLMYDLTARIMDAESVPVTMVIVSSWARTGWNVIRPNVLIDATATRDVTAWQQLRGRAMRAMPTWDHACYRLVTLLLGPRAPGLDASAPMPPDVLTAVEELHEVSQAGGGLDDASRALLLDAHRTFAVAATRKYPAREGVARILAEGSLDELTAGEREELAVGLMLLRNKVTHIYEMVKGSGSTLQVRHDRPSRRWLRTEAIAAKHEREFSVSPLTGRYGSGEGHAPLICSGDPRQNLPSRLRRQLGEVLGGCDPLVIRGWITAVSAGAEEQLGLE